jgi:hypothetical protein
MSIRVSAIDPVQRERFTLQLLKHWDAACRGGDLPAIGTLIQDPRAYFPKHR